MIKRHLFALAALCLSAFAFTSPAAVAAESGHQAEPAALHAAFPKAIDAGLLRVALVDISSYHHEVSPMTVRAKVVCSHKNLCAHQKADGTSVEAAQLTFRAVYQDKTGDWSNAPENAIFGEYTPSLSFSMYVTNPDAHRQFEQGHEYYVDLTPASTA